MRHALSIASGTVLTLASCAGIAMASEKHVDFKDLPLPVKKKAQRESQGATVRGYAKEVENGKTEYEVEMIVAGKSRDVSIDPSGKVIEVEQQVALDSVPPAAMAAIRKEAGRDSIGNIEEVKSDAETAYEAQILSNGKQRQVRVHANGSAAPEQDQVV